MGSLKFSEYADSPTIFLPPQQHFRPSSYSHSVLHHQPPKRFMPSVPYQSLFNGQVSDVPAAGPSCLSRKRKFGESSREDTQSQGAGMTATDFRRVPPNCTNGMKPPLVNTELLIDSLIDTEPLNNMVPPKDGQTDAWDPQSFTCSHSYLSGVSSASNEGAEKRCKARRHEIARNFSTTTDGSVEAIGELRSTFCESLPDKMSVELGVGWKSLSDDPDVQAAARGWAKYIEKRFPIEAVSFLAKHTDQSSLVGAHDGFYVFTADLNQGTFVAKEWLDVVADLEWSSDFWFGGRELLHPVESSVLGQSDSATNPAGQRVESSSAVSQSDMPSPLEQPLASPVAWVTKPEWDVEMKMDG